MRALSLLSTEEYFILRRCSLLKPDVRFCTFFILLISIVPDAGLLLYTLFMDSYKHVFEALDAANVDYIIVGGVAMNLLGCPRFTNDIDVLLALNTENIHKMTKAMAYLGYEKRIPLELDELGDEKKAVEFVKEKNLLAYTFYHPKEPLYSVDVLVDASLKFDSFKQNMLYKDVWGLSLPVVSIDDLIGLKQGTDREKDALDIANLLEYKGL